jgi:hypothetical protein
MNPEIKPLARGLTYAGGLPFVALAGLAVAGRPLFGLDPLAALRAYALAIAAFMAGTIWGYVIPNARAPQGALLLVLSNALALAAFFAALAVSPRLALGVDLLAFLALFAVDRWAGRLGLLAPDYLALRAQITAAVVVALGAAWAAA